jgi:serine/threonine protein kinase
MDISHLYVKLNLNPSPSFNTTLADFKFICKLGEGIYSTVYKVIRKSDNKCYALKQVRLYDKQDLDSE